MDPIPRQVARGFTHLVKWVNYHARTGSQPLISPARVTVYSSSPAADDAAVEGFDLLEAAS